MERLEEDFYTSDGVISKFRLRGDGRSLSNPASSEYGELTYTAACGYGYRFGLEWRRAGFTRQPWIYMDALSVNPKLGELTVTISAESTSGPPPIFMPDPSSPSGRGYAVSQSTISKTFILKAPHALTHLATMNVLGSNLARVTLSFKVAAQHPSQHLLRPVAQVPTHVTANLRNALQASLDGGAFIDIKIYGFSRRMESGEVSRPLPVYANSTTLKAKSTYFDTMFSRSYFAESSVNELTGAATESEDGLCSAEEYDYDSDSDLDFTEDASDNMVKDVAPSSSTPSDGHGLGRIVHIKDIAHRTLRSFIWYCYTGEVIFSPLKSEKREQKQPEDTEEKSLIANTAPSCSPKSMYRLADKYGIAELEDRAFDEIRNRLTVHNILDELFSTFTCRYDRVRQMEINFICGKLDCPEIADGLPRVVAGFATDSAKQPNFAVLSLLIQKLMERRSSANNPLHIGPVGPGRFIPDDIFIPDDRSHLTDYF